MDRSHAPQFGFTLYDLLVTVAVISIVGTFTVSLQDALRRQTLSSGVYTLIGDMNLARSEALKRKAPVAICKSADGKYCSDENEWEQGWIIFVDENDNKLRDDTEEIVRVSGALNSIDLDWRASGFTRRNEYVTYLPTGFINKRGSFVFCDRVSGESKAVVVYFTGRARIERRPRSPTRCAA